MKTLSLIGTGFALLLVGCSNTPPPGPEHTGGGGVTYHEDHSARKQDASGTGSSAAAFGQGPVPGSGAAKDEPGNAQSPSESNGGVPAGSAPHDKAL
jgi:hypothetical protein